MFLLFNYNLLAVYWIIHRKELGNIVVPITII